MSAFCIYVIAKSQIVIAFVQIGRSLASLISPKKRLQDGRILKQPSTVESTSATVSCSSAVSMVASLVEVLCVSLGPPPQLVAATGAL